MAAAENRRWEQGSSRIIYRADQDVDEKSELYSSLPDGSNNNRISDPLAAGGEVFGFVLF